MIRQPSRKCVADLPSRSVEPAEDLLHLGVVLLDRHNGILNALQALLLVWAVGRSILILLLSVVLDLLAAVLDLCETKGG